MKKIFLALLALMPLAALAQWEYTYRPLLEEGKEWDHQESYYGANRNTWTWKLVGDTLIGESTYKKLYMLDYKKYRASSWQSSSVEVVESIDSQYWGALREEDRKVYCVMAGETEADMLYDFGAKSGDTFVSLGVELYVSGEDYVEFDGNIFRRLYVFDDREGVERNPFTIVEGIGSVHGLICTVEILFLPYNNMGACREDGITIFKGWQDFYMGGIDPAGIGVAEQSASPSPGTLYDLQGRRVSEKGKVNSEQLPRGVYIQNGKKFVVK